MAVAQGLIWSPGQMPADPQDWADWVPIRSFSFQRGKNDDLDEFDAGSATIVVDNADDSMDPLAGGSFWDQSEMWLPVSIIAHNGTTGFPLWTGFITSVAPTGTNQFAGTVTITAVDWIGWGSQWDCPSAWRGNVVSKMTPVFWWAGLTDVLSNWSGGTLFDELTGVYDGVVTGAATVDEADALIPGNTSAAFRVNGDASNTAYVLAPSSPELASVSEWTVNFWFKSPDAGFFLVRSEIGGTTAWHIRVDSSGNIVASLCNGSGISVLSATTTGIDTRDNEPVFVSVEFKSSTTRSINVWAHTSETDVFTGTVSGGGAGAVGGGGRIYYGPTATPSVVVRFDELVITNQIYGGFNNPAWNDADNDAWWLLVSDTLTAKTAKLATVIGAELPIDFTWSGNVNEMGDPVQTVDTAADLVTGIGAMSGGAAWCQRDGRIRVRDFPALADVDFADEYDTEIAQVTDVAAASGSPLVIRPGPRGRSGVRHDRIVNIATYRSESTFGVGGDRKIDRASLALYGRREREITYPSFGGNSTSRATACQDMLDRYATPPVEIDDFSIQPLSDPSGDLLDWCIEDLDLEKTVTYQETSPGGVLVIDQQCRIIRESWDFTGMDLTVKVGVAMTGPYVTP